MKRRYADVDTESEEVESEDYETLDDLFPIFAFWLNPEIPICERIRECFGVRERFLKNWVNSGTGEKEHYWFERLNRATVLLSNLRELRKDQIKSVLL